VTKQKVTGDDGLIKNGLRFPFDWRRRMGERPPTEAALLLFILMERDLLGLKLLYQVVSGLVASRDRLPAP
jgi:hypothetical protein